MRNWQWTAAALLVLALFASVASAGGDKNRGDKGQGETQQWQNR